MNNQPNYDMAMGFLQTFDVLLNLNQVSNDTLLEELQRQNKEYLEKIVTQNEDIQGNLNERTIDILERQNKIIEQNEKIIKQNKEIIDLQCKMWETFTEQNGEIIINVEELLERSTKDGSK